MSAIHFANEFYFNIRHTYVCISKLTLDISPVLRFTRVSTFNAGEFNHPQLQVSRWV